MNLLGGVTLMLVLASASLYVLNRIAPKQTGARVRAHCIIGILSLATALAYFSQSWMAELRFNGIVSFSLLLLTVGSGIVLRFLKEAHEVRYHAASLHPAIVLALLLALAVHLMNS